VYTVERAGMAFGQQRAEPSSEIRVLVANLAGVLAELVVRSIQEQQDMVLVGEVHGRVALLTAVDTSVHVLVLGARDVEPLPPICTHLFNEYPHLRVVVVATRGDSAMLYWLGVRKHTVGELSPPALVAGVRQAFQVSVTD
jgi:hypothetical protein